MPRSTVSFTLFFALLGLLFSATLQSANLDSPALGEVVYAKGDEYIRGPTLPAWAAVAPGQEVNQNDEVRTGPNGSLGILLRDETQIRLRRNTRFKIADVRDGNDVEQTRLELISGAFWSRAQALSRLVKSVLYRRPKVQIRTSTTTIGIRGTDWFTSVDPDTNISRTVVISGEAEVANSFGTVVITSGEEAIAEPGKAPVKRVIVNLKGRPLMALTYEPDWSAFPTDSDSRLEAVIEAIQTRQPTKAFDLLEPLAIPVSTAPAAHLYAALLMHHSRYDEAIAYSDSAKKVFPQDATFEVVQGHAYFLTDEAENMRTAIERALDKDPDSSGALHLRGVYFTIVQPDRGEAVSSYQRAIEAAENPVESLNNLALVNADLGHFEKAKSQMAAARAARADSATIQANSGALAQSLNRLDDAEAFYQVAESLDENNPHVMLARGVKHLMLGEHDEAINAMLAAIAIAPNLPDAHTNLAIAYYQAGRFPEARAMIDKAMIIDPNDPVAPKVGTTMGVDQADIGRAIRLAQSALEKSLAFDYFAVESLESARSGVTNLGSAYANLGLTSWANYYAQLAFTPYEASSHFLLNSVYGPRSNTASNGALNLGLALAPTAISQPNRFFEFVREPGIDFTIGGSRGDTGGESTRSGNATVQGFGRLPVPFSYRLDYIDSDVDQSRSKVLNISAGSSLFDRRHDISANFFASKDHNRVDGPITSIDIGDRNETTVLAGTLNYHFRWDYDNRVLLRLGFQKTTTNEDNARPYGNGISGLGQSLVTTFGEQSARAITESGLFDLNTVLGPPCSSVDPCFGIGPFFSIFGPQVDVTIPDTIVPDTFANRTVNSKSSSETFYLQFRHMFRWGDFDLTYGAELLDRDDLSIFTDVFESAPGSPASVSPTSPFLFSPFGFGTLIDAGFNFSFFTNFDLVNTTFRAESDPFFATAYGQARYEYEETWWVELGVYARRLDGAREQTGQIDPRIGVGWRFAEGHWLRAAYQSELILAVPPQGPLSPVAVMGFVPDVTQVLNGTAIKNLQVEWDAEWHPRLFTSVRFEEQRLDDWIPLFVPGFSLEFSDTRIRSLDVNINAWIFERFGGFLNYVHQDAEFGVAGKSALPFLPDKRFAGGLTWIHPRQIVASASMNYVGSRYGDAINATKLDDYWTTNLSVRWQPLEKHASFGVSISNLFDEGVDIASGIRAAGRTVVLSAEARF